MFHCMHLVAEAGEFWYKNLSSPVGEQKVRTAYLPEKKAFDVRCMYHSPVKFSSAKEVSSDSLDSGRRRDGRRR